MSITSPYAAHENGFLAPRKTSPIGISGAIAIHVGVAAVIMSMPGMPIGKKVFPPPPLVTISVPLKPPPPEPKPPLEQKQIVQKPEVYTPDPIISLPRQTEFVPPRSDPIIPPFDPGPARIELPPVIKPPIPKPVFVDARMDPRNAGRVQPDYPPARLREEEEGKVIVRVKIGADGRVLSIEPLSTTHPDFWRATQTQALKAWRFIPATRDGVAVELLREMTVYFRMQGQ